MNFFLPFPQRDCTDVLTYSPIVLFLFDISMLVETQNRHKHPFKSKLSHAIPHNVVPVPILAGQGHGSDVCLSQRMRHR